MNTDFHVHGAGNIPRRNENRGYTRSSKLQSLDYQNTNHGWRSNDVAGKIKRKFAMIHFQIRKLRCNLKIRNIVIRKGGVQFRLI